MVALSWGDTGQKFFETGIDRGVLFVRDKAVVWNGLISVSETPSGGGSNPYYADGIKYLNMASREEFEAKIEAYGAPPEFDACLGVLNFGGLSLSGQIRESFSFSYRTRIGNDVDGVEHGYKIHIIYGAKSGSSEVQNQSLSDSPEPVKHSWSITAIPVTVDEFMPSAHFAIDTRTVSSDVLLDIEQALYGSSYSDPIIPDPSYLLDVIQRMALREKPNDPGVYSIQYGALVENTNDPGTFSIVKTGLTEKPNDTGIYKIGAA